VNVDLPRVEADELAVSLQHASAGERDDERVGRLRGQLGRRAELT
jgi:hypothetical protein